MYIISLEFTLTFEVLSNTTYFIINVYLKQYLTMK